MVKTSLTPVEYEVLFALLQLKHKGEPEAPLKSIHKEINQRRKSLGMQSISIQHVYYYLKKLTTKPFIKKINHEKITAYKLVKGTWKLIQSPPLCIHFNDADFILICAKTATCRRKPSMKCVERLVNYGLIQIPQKIKVATATPAKT
ncbi:MAG: hypothetical protein QW734_02035 [Candidatus Bathyarchaeia archaeon]